MSSTIKKIGSRSIDISDPIKREIWEDYVETQSEKATETLAVALHNLEIAQRCFAASEMPRQAAMLQRALDVLNGAPP